MKWIELYADEPDLLIDVGIAICLAALLTKLIVFISVFW
jgi:hypothetical protein